MRKMPCLFQREFRGHNDAVLLRDVTPGCEWVLAGEGLATLKWDGTACMFRDGKLYARYDAKHGKTPPPNFEPCQPEPDPVTGHHPGWVPVGDEPQFRWHREALTTYGAQPDGTYELVGPRINGNRHGFPDHFFASHGGIVYPLLSEVPLSWDEIREALEQINGEGFVFHHPDGRMCKIRRADYGLPWPTKEAAE